MKLQLKMTQEMQSEKDKMDQYETLSRVLGFWLSTIVRGLLRGRGDSSVFLAPISRGR